MTRPCPAEKPFGNSSPLKSRDRILIAEDDPLFRRIFLGWLQKWGYEVVAVDDGNKAWEALRQGDAPDLLVFDWMMPGIDGPELCRRIRILERSPQPYILMVTSKDAKQDIVSGLEAGADDYLTKPFDVGELRARLGVGKRILSLQHELIQAHEDLRFQASHDSLTGLWNRCSTLNLLGRELQRSARSQAPTGILMIDIDHFKNINDVHGHLTGDLVLKEVAQRITEGVRPYDFVGRYGGEEFLVVLSSCGVDDLRTVGERIRSELASVPVCTETVKIDLTASIGGAATARPVSDLELLSAADDALYQAKRDGRNRVCIHKFAH
jgi:two-component system, cell cycle response regulator